MDGPGEQEFLRQYLAVRDASCPSCGYNLRGTVGEKCPECARPIELGVVRPGPAAALTWFLLLAFGWVFAAGVMNSIRNANLIYSYVESQRSWGIASIQSRVIISGRTQTLLPTTVANAPPMGFWATAWDTVPAMTWASAGWAFTLAIGCGIGLILMLRRRGRPFGAAGDRRMVRFACAMFSVYSLWHVGNFFLEFM